MPSGNSDTIPITLHVVCDLAPKKVLDVGAGLGKYGVLFREYLELHHANRRPDFFEGNGNCQRQTRIDAVEGFRNYIGSLHKCVYDHIYVEDILEFISREWQYDVIFLGDVLEHFDKEVAKHKLLPTLTARAIMGVLIVVPAGYLEQGAIFGNPLEVHRSAWFLSLIHI